MIKRRVGPAQADAMGARLVDVELGWHLGLPQRQIEDDAVLGRHAGVGVGVEEERRRRIGASPAARSRGRPAMSGCCCRAPSSMSREPLWSQLSDKVITG